jgi:hypothetical protein
MNFKVEFSRNRVPCIWEKGGYKDEKSYSQVITNQHGQPKRPLMIRNNLYEQSDNHALMPISLRNYIVRAEISEGRFNIDVYKVEKINDSSIDTVMTNNFNTGKWNVNPEMMLYDAIDSAMRKAKDFTSSAPYYVML